MVSPSQLQKENIPWPNASVVLWGDEEGTSPPIFQPLQVILQGWLLSEKHQLGMKFENSNHLWVHLANFLMHYSLSMAWTVTVSYSPTQQVVIILTR